MSFTSLLTHQIYKNTASSSQNDFGEWAYTFTQQTSTPITCRVSPWTIAFDTDRGETILVTGKYDDVRYRCFMDSDEDINTGDRVVYDSKEYRVKEVSIDSSSHHKTALLVEL